MTVVKKKSRPKVKKRSTLDRELQEQLELFRASADARNRVARAAFDVQDEETKEIIRRMQDRLSVGITGYIRVWPGGRNRSEQSYPVNVGLEYMQMNAFYIAVEIMKDLAMMDVRVANFTFPESVCAECGVRLNRPKKRRAGKGN